MFGDIFDSHEWDQASGISWVMARDNANHPTIHRTAPTTKNYLAQIVNSAKIEKLRSGKKTCLAIHMTLGAQFHGFQGLLKPTNRPIMSQLISGQNSAGRSYIQLALKEHGFEQC